MTDTPVTILDHIENLTVPGRVFDRPANECSSLVCFWEGMTFLYSIGKKCDTEGKRILDPTGEVEVFSFGSDYRLDRIPTRLLSCVFQWYSVTACNYVETVGAIAKQQDSRFDIGDYKERVIPQVLAYRNKVGAHPVFSRDDKRDSDAERLASVIPQVTFKGDTFAVGEMRVGLRRGGNWTDSSAIQPWSLCRVHESLRNRYWPTTSPDGQSNSDSQQNG